MYPLQGLRVIDMSTYVAAPSCARFFSDMGAKVLKIESPKGDPMRLMGRMVGMPIEEDENPGFDMMNSGKELIQLNIKNSAERSFFLELLKNTDILITNIRNDSLKKLGLDYDSLKAEFPALIYAHITAYGESGEMANQPGYDFTAYYARAGISGTLYEKGTSPMITVPAFGDFQAGMYLAAGILSAYIGSLESGRGTKVTTSLLATGVYNMSYMIASAQYDQSYPISRYDNLNPLQCIYKTRDGRWIQVAYAVYSEGFKTFYAAIGREDLLNNPVFTDIASLQENADEIIKIIEKEILNRDLEDWIGIFREKQIPCDPLQLFEDVAKDAQVLENEYLIGLDYKNRRIMMPNAPVQIQNYNMNHATYAPREPLTQEEALEWFEVERE